MTFCHTQRPRRLETPPTGSPPVTDEFAQHRPVSRDAERSDHSWFLATVKPAIDVKSTQRFRLMPNNFRSRRHFLAQLGGVGASTLAGHLPLVANADAAAPAPTAKDSRNKLVGMYVHQHWPYHHPYAARTWTFEDWRGYADSLHELGYNAILIWPVLETMPNPLTPSDRANLAKIARVIDMLHQEFGMRAYIALCPNVVANNSEAAKSTFEKRHFFACDTRANPADANAMRSMLEWRATLLATLKQMDGIAIIDSDPGGYPGSTNAEFVELLAGHRQLLDKLRPGIELIYWMHVGWLGYGRFYETGTLSFSTEEESVDMLTRLKERNLEPWGLANGMAAAQKLGLESRVINFNYGRIEGEPSFPMTNFSGNSAYEGGAAPSARGVMGNAQTHCVQLPNTFAFARGALGQPVTEHDHVLFADNVIPGLGEAIVRAWKALSATAPEPMQLSCRELSEISDERLAQRGPLNGLLFGSPRRFINDLTMMLQLRAAFETLRVAADNNKITKHELDAFIAKARAWQKQHGYENSWSWPNLSETLRRLNSADVNTVLDNRFDPYAKPKLAPGETPFQHVARKLREEESFTPRLLAALDATRKRME